MKMKLFSTKGKRLYSLWRQRSIAQRTVAITLAVLVAFTALWQGVTFDLWASAADINQSFTYTRPNATAASTYFTPANGITNISALANNDGSFWDARFKVFETGDVSQAPIIP
jgi:hypothetical protein